MDIEIYQNCEYVSTFFDIADTEQGLFEFLCDFWKKQRARLRMQKKSSTFAQSIRN